MDSILTSEMQDVALTFLEGLDSALGLSVAILLRHGEWDQLLNKKCDPMLYTCPRSYFRDALSVSFLRKLRVPIEGIDRSGPTREKWMEAEKQCFRTNSTFFELMDFGTLYGQPCPERIGEFIASVRKILQKMIGSRPPDTFDGVFGPGATISDGATRSSVPHKMSSRITLTGASAEFLVPWVGSKWSAGYARRHDGFTFVRGNKFFEVPKTALINRACAKEPSLNAFYQRGIGVVLAKRLKAFGIDLSSAKETHMRVACSSSLDESFATIDLSSASDTIATAVVKLLLPSAWFDLLSDLRSPYTKVKGHDLKLEKFSSMGNGFTFELESALFLAISMAVDPTLQPGKTVFVFGDDIIVPTNIAHEVILALRFFGFSVNTEKTFLRGPFRESCGGDYFDGLDVRPIFLKELPNEPQQWIALANQFRRISQSKLVRSDCRLTAGLRRVWFRCLDRIPSSIRRCRGPEGLGDIVIHDKEAQWSIRWRASGIRYVRVYRPAKLRNVSFARFCPDIQFAAALYGVVLTPRIPRKVWPDGEDYRVIPLRGAVLGYKVGWVPYS